MIVTINNNENNNYQDLHGVCWHCSKLFEYINKMHETQNIILKKSI